MLHLGRSELTQTFKATITLSLGAFFFFFFLGTSVLLFVCLFENFVYFWLC